MSRHGAPLLALSLIVRWLFFGRSILKTKPAPTVKKGACSRKEITEPLDQQHLRLAQLHQLGDVFGLADGQGHDRPMAIFVLGAACTSRATLTVHRFFKPCVGKAQDTPQAVSSALRR
jgi:hypothetical protein